MKKMSEQVDKVISAYRALASIPGLSNGRIFKKGAEVSSLWSERNLETNKVSKIAFSQQLGPNLNVLSESSFGVDVSNEIISSVSPSENLRAVIRELTDSKNVKKQYLEIWKYRHRSQCIDLQALEIHGDVYADGEFGSFDWDESENRVIYIAERKLPKTEPFFKRKPAKAKGKSEASGDDEIMKGKEYDYKPEWGEQLAGKHQSAIIMCELDTEKFTVFDWLPQYVCPAQIRWSPDNSQVTGVAWATEPRRLGLIFCTNRPSFIFSSSVEQQSTLQISKENKAVRSPRYSSDGKYLIWLQRDAGGPHHSCHQLVKAAIPVITTAIVETVIDIVPNEVTIENGEKFTGIYATDLPKRAFALDGRRLLFSTPQRTEGRSYVVDIDTGKITDISDKSHPCSTTILDINEDIVLASRSSLKQPAQLIIAKLPKSGNEKDIKWEVISRDSIPVPDAIKSATLEYLNLEHKDVPDSVTNFTGIFFGGNSPQQKTPLIVWPHGGPHSCFSNSYSLEAAFLYMLGFSVVQVNFRGSTGAGDLSLKFLQGKVGKADVNDCILATDKAIEHFSVDRSRCVLLGGSHGGFLIAHLSALPRYKAAVSRNPVIDIASMFNGTDIPDWCTFEAGVEFNETGPVSEELMLAMRRASPLVTAHLVKAPTLLCLGTQDKRVPYHQGMEYYHKLKANNCKARVLIYEDNHSLSSTGNETDQLINSALWFLEHTVIQE